MLQQNDAKQVALLALQQYDVAFTHIDFLQHSDAITYKVECALGSNYLLRIHSDQYNHEEVTAELHLLHDLNQCSSLTLPQGIVNRNGSFVTQMQTERGWNPVVTVMRWVEGQHYEGSLSDSSIYKMGGLVATFHNDTRKLAPSLKLNRPIWGAERFLAQFAKLEQYASEFLSPQALLKYQACADKIVLQLTQMSPDHVNYGIIHADLHLGNFVFHNDQPYIIDFGRCGYGYFLYDIASTLLGLTPKQRKIFIQGYEQFTSLPDDFISQIECFFVMVMIENYCHHCSNPNETQHLIAEQPYAMAYLRCFLSGNSFLFQTIEPEVIT